MTAHPWMQTRDGHIVDLVEPDLSALSIDEIAHAIGVLPRFNGHTQPAPYVVAQHCVFVAEHVEWTEQCAISREGLQLAALCHDAHEAILGDLTSPVKRALVYFGGGEALERLDRTMAAAIRKRLGCCDPMPVQVKIADMRALVTERRDLMGDFQAQDWEVDFEPFTMGVRPWSHDRAKAEWLHLYKHLGGRP